MKNTEVLKKGRDLLLALHKSLLDLERSFYENVHGPVTSGHFLNLLLEDSEFAWLRKFSTLIVDIDEMFAQKDGFNEEAVDVHLSKMREIVSMSHDDKDFIAKYQSGLQQNLEAAAIQGELRSLLA
ncbi:MAG: hypothetical protein HOP17_10470 [Acidobacteria bacterium]|nr:hypothetical protein [Acidobacteriota bacterium]